MEYPIRLYLRYLSTDELAASLERVENSLTIRWPERTSQQRKLLLDIRADLREALAVRQLSLLEQGAHTIE
jgi:hypothetical protein